MEFVPDHARQEELRKASNTSVDMLKTVASQMRLPRVHITHRVLGSFVPAD
jgi:hypothetical protein